MSQNDEEEKDHWFNVLRTFLFYEEFVAFDLGRRQEHINRMPAKYADRLPNPTFEKFSALHHAAEGNQDFFKDMVHFHVTDSFHAPPGSNAKPVMPTKAGVPIELGQQHRNNAVLHSLVREWSEAGAKERETTFQVLVDELKLRLPVTAENAYKQKVLVPGCGLGRLPLEIASAGYTCQGNEFSAFMAVASNFVLNGLTESGAYRVYPWISNVCNVVKIEDSLQHYDIPDRAAVDMLNAFSPPPVSNIADSSDSEPDSVERAQTVDGNHSSRVWRRHYSKNRPTDSSNYEERDDPNEFFPKFSMAAGDFVEVYTNLKSKRIQDLGGEESVDSGASNWDAVVTCFFVDTAPVVLDYIEAIFRMLKPGGVWVNLGPLLYHWAAAADAHVDQAEDPRYRQSVELSYEELKHVIKGYGFEFLSESWHDCTYTRCDTSMMWTTYKAVQFTVRKPVVVCEDCTVKAPKQRATEPGPNQEQEN
eukprot:CAMPEP_0185003614 /NCGR_PEP_ID=MMETSP1098-20130426/76952_1 /TAXON_ID=89044 /ORGANISM="Spumella elongata, Strain CCAP 955/1" /LENGTH=475 /DNA_ID=CAMNT_0027531297 /DNA_START=74 /DNA_END=1501 /DNA_ORIENTATION=+